ncbi:MAG: hypothetical protein A2Y90_04825 [Chloroflexi bacterium RBG_13_52_12]|nr:MAG: hypothetical protein A2Y90_04825 [Chloroflexi bacterium RBG_13_52_12]
MAKKVLFINNLSPASVFPELLADAGYEVYEAFDSETGLRRLDAQSYDLILLLESATVESWVLCEKIRSLTPAPLIVISSNASMETCVKAINAGADFFMRKPFGALELLARINVLFQRSAYRQPVSLAS